MPKVLTLWSLLVGRGEDHQGQALCLRDGWLWAGTKQRKGGAEMSQIHNILKDKGASRARVPGLESLLCPLLAV